MKSGIIAALLWVPVGAAAQGAGTPAPQPLARHYHEGETVHYQMDATNQGRATLLRYSARVDGVVRRDSLGRFVEELEWSHLIRNDAAIALPAGARVRQRLTLAPEYMIPPNVAQMEPALVGPVLDLLTFYVDLWLAAKMPLAQAGNHAHVPMQGTNSFADGRNVLVGEDAIDFDMTLAAIDSARGTARLVVRHVAPEQGRVRLPADWMRAPVGDAPNNWVQIERGEGGTFVAGVGKETFDVELIVRLADGRIVSATMDNPVEVLERVCKDRELTMCGEGVRYRILRKVAIH
jgi:hypothetical protein